MKLPKCEPSRYDRIATREELFQVLELVGGFEAQTTQTGPTRELLECLEGDSTAIALEILDELTSNEERLLREIEPFNSLRANKAGRIN